MADYQSYNSEKLNAKEDGASLGSAQLVCLGEGDEWLLISATACKQAVLPLLPDGLGTLYPLATFPECLIISAPLFSQVMSSQCLLPLPSATLLTLLAL